MNSAVALGEPADAETVDGVVQTVRSAWEAQRRAVVAGGSSDEWSHVLASRSGFARVVASQLMASMSAGLDRAISDAALTVSNVRLDPAGRAIANFCVVEDGGFASFGDGLVSGGRGPGDRCSRPRETAESGLLMTSHSAHLRRSVSAIGGDVV